MQLKHLTNELSKDISEANIPKGDVYFKTPPYDRRRWGEIQDVVVVDGYTINVYHNHTVDGNHVLQRFKERITDGTATFRNPLTREISQHKDVPGWKSYPPTVLHSIVKKSIEKINSEFGLYDDDSLNDYMVIDDKKNIVLRFNLMNINPDKDDTKRQVLIFTVLTKEMLHAGETSWDMKTSSNFIDFETVIIEDMGEKKSFIIFYV